MLLHERDALGDDRLAARLAGRAAQQRAVHGVDAARVGQVPL
jgi:hypothetical protein